MPQIDNKISLGNLLSIGTVLASVLFAWASMGASATQNTLDIERQAVVSSQHEGRLRALETREAAQIARIETQLLQINRTLDALAGKLDSDR